MASSNSKARPAVRGAQADIKHSITHLPRHGLKTMAVRVQAAAA